MVFAITSLVLIASLTACKPKRNSARIIVGSTGKITSLDPAQANTFQTLQLLRALGDPLYKLDNNGNLSPVLASGLPQISNKGLTVSIPLRKDVLFHDGTIFDAYAMAFSLKRFTRIGTLNYILGGRIASIETPEKYLLRLRLNRPSSSLQGLLTSINLTPVSPKAYADHENNFLNKRFVGTGAYKLSNFQVQKQRLEPFEEYWGETSKNKGIDYINLSNSTALFGAMRTGEVDVLISNSLDEDQKLALNNMKIQGKLKEGVGPALEIGYITLLTNKYPFNQKRLRKALSLSLNRDLISKRVSYGLRKPLRSIIPPTLKGGKDNTWPSYNPIEANKLYESAGFCQGKQLSIQLTFRSNVPADKLFALTWQSQIKQDLNSCLKLSLNGVESTTVYRQLGEGAFQAVILDWRGAYPDPEAYLYPLLSCRQAKGSICESGEAAISGSFWTDKAMESSLRLGDQLLGQQRFKKLLSIEKKAAEGSAYLPVWIVRPKAWAQLHISTPEFDSSGKLLLSRLRVLR